MRAIVSIGLVAPFLALVAPPQAMAQGRSPQILTLGGGVARYDLDGDKGTTPVFVARFDGNIGPYFVIEPGFAYMHFTGQFGGRNYLLPEISFQGQGYVGPVRPYIGAGIGFANISTGPSQSQVSLHAVTGLRIRFGRGWGMRLEARARSVDPWQNHTYDLTSGIMRVLPGSF
jgi:hypothetical protein